MTGGRWSSTVTTWQHEALALESHHGQSRLQETQRLGAANANGGPEGCQNAEEDGMKSEA